MLTDEFGFDKMFNNYGFSFELNPISENKTKLINKGYGTPKNVLAKTMNVFMFKKMAAKIRNQALNGIKELVKK